MTTSYLVQILLPKETGRGEEMSHDWFEQLLEELRQIRRGDELCPGARHGLWQSGGGTERDTIAVIEVMTEGLLTDYWRALRERLEQELTQDEIILRAQKIIPL
jgi:hypothetical protein